MSGNCSDKPVVVPREDAPIGPQWSQVEIGWNKHWLVPVVKVGWTIKPDGCIFFIRGSEISIVDENTNRCVCTQFSYSFNNVLTPDYKKWNFSLDVVVEPRHTYTLTVFNVPEPENDQYRIKRQITIPGSLWDPSISANVSIDKKPQISIVVMFKTAPYSEMYQVTIQNGIFSCAQNASKKNRTSLTVPFEFDLKQLSHCNTLVTIQPFFIRCKSDCKKVKRKVYHCQSNLPKPVIIKMVLLLVFGGCLSYVLWRASRKDSLNIFSSAAKEQPDVFQVQKRKRVLIIYSLDHHLYKNIVLKLCGFLRTKCGTEVVLDLLDFTRLGVLGGIQWLDWQKEQIDCSSDKILILCSRGVQAKWRAMCGDKQVFLKEDACSPVGDMLTPSLTLLLPHFIRSASFKKYIVGYFEEVSSEEDIPSPFNVTVRYKLMKQFEEVFFRILDIEKHEPGRVKQIDGLSEDKYHQSPSGRALRDAVDAFRAYQLEHPQWFEDELMESSELEEDTVREDEIHENYETLFNHLIYCKLDSTQVVSHVKIKENCFSVNETELLLAEKIKFDDGVQL
ncbi:interleukin-17 receptor A [Cololabis saira]|uniref:interleukin-17 receptor A n=1 Tax=Cololabis saira TaxID=129043 RepID=UPI002AD3107A|nr:interleukin-17 receptor A [Cololabis saira]